MSSRGLWINSLFPGVLPWGHKSFKVYGSESGHPFTYERPASMGDSEFFPFYFIFHTLLSGYEGNSLIFNLSPEIAIYHPLKYIYVMSEYIYVSSEYFYVLV